MFTHFGALLQELLTAQMDTLSRDSLGRYDKPETRQNAFFFTPCLEKLFLPLFPCV